MARLERTSDSAYTWVLESSGDALSDRMAEFRQIFNHYVQRDQTITDQFTLQLLLLQADALTAMAKKQEAELKRLKQLEADMAALKKEMMELKNPPALDKPKLPRPQKNPKAPE